MEYAHDYSFHNWQNTYYSALERLGYNSMMEFYKKNPGVSFTQLEELLGVKDDRDSINHFRILALFTDEVQSQEHLLFAAKEIVVRLLYEHNVDWKRTKRSIENRMKIFCGLRSFFEHKCKLPFDDASKAAKRLCDSLEEQVSVKSNWLPKSTEDPLLTRIFNEFWPTIEEHMAK